MQQIAWRQVALLGLVFCLVSAVAHGWWDHRKAAMVLADLSEATRWLQGAVIVVDPGHGGADPGAVVSGTEEKGIVLQIALSLKQMLEQQGATVILTRSKDEDLGGRIKEELAKRVQIVGQHQAMAFVSVHANKDSCRCWGAQTFYQRNGAPAGKELALAIQNRLRKLTPTTRTALAADYFVLRTSPAPAAMVEVGFLSDGAERQRLKDPAYQRTLAAAVTLGIADFFRSQAPDANAGGSLGK